MAQHRQTLTQNYRSARAVQLQTEGKAVWSEPAESGWILLLSAALAYDIIKNNGFLT